MNVDLAFAVDFFNKNDNFTILCHTNPDGDTLGSGYALCGALHLTGKRARVICDEKPSPRFDYLLQSVQERLLSIDDAKEVIVTVDVADLDLLGEIKSKYPKIDLCIDHHISNKDYALHTLLDTDAAACAEILWELIKKLGVTVTPEIAACIYTGVSTDTGCYKYSNTTINSHIITAEVMKYDFDIAKINYVMFEMKTRERVLLEQKALSGIEYYFSGRCAVIILTAEMLDGIDSEDASNVSALPKQIEGVLAGIVLKQKSDSVWKVSVRTAEPVNAQAICSILGGGGHLRAAGCTLTGDLESVKGSVLKEIEKQL
jgi:phosphoesterase RecJ-like protein